MAASGPSVNASFHLAPLVLARLILARLIPALLVLTLLVLTLLGAAACQPGVRWKASGASGAAPRLRLTAPADGATNVPTSTEIGFTVTGSRDVTVVLTDPAGQAIGGSLRTDGSTWVPDNQLQYATAYALVATATNSAGTKATVRGGFTTMARPDNLVDVHSWIGDNQVVGVGMPIVVTFGLDVPAPHRADVQRRLFVHSEPTQPGSWNWFSGHEVHYRSKDYWKPGTALTVRIATGGLSWGVKDWYGRHDLTVHATVGERLSIVVDNATKRMTVTRDGTVLKAVPVSLGKPSAPSSTGNLLVMTRNEWEWFDSSTYGVPVDSPGGYRTKVFWDLRLTWGGEYIHAAPWSVGDQGHRNVSHGCVNVSTEAATWLYGITKVGDPVTVLGTQRHVTWGDGWTDWDRPWSAYVKGSAIPDQPTPTPAPS